MGCFRFHILGFEAVNRYIAEQEEHHRKRSFSEELKLFLERYGLKWRDEESVETLSGGADSPTPR
jgi:hypothetical protein